MTAQPLLDVNDLTVEFATRRGIVKAVQHVNISVAKGETLGIVGEGLQFVDFRFRKGEINAATTHGSSRGWE